MIMGSPGQMQTTQFIDTVVTQWLAALGPRYDHCE